MKPSIYNFVWPADDLEKVMVFNSLTTALVEVKKTHVDLLNVPRFDYDALPADAKLFIDGLRQGGFVLDDATDELKILKFAYNSNKYDPMMLGLVIAPTLRCNFACPYCFEQSNDTENRRDGQNAFMPEHIQNKLLKFIDHTAKTARNVSVIWYGGEPLLAKKIIFELSQKMIAITEEKKIGYSAGMITNGYLLSKDPGIAQKMIKSRIEFVQITIDGPPDVHNNRRMLKSGSGPTFDRILEGIQLLRKNNIKVSLRINIDRSNVDSASKLLDILANHDMKDIHVYLGHVVSTTSGCKSYESSCALTEEFTVLNQAFYEALKQKDFKPDQRPYYPELALACGANGTNSFVLDPDGDVYKCWTEIGDKARRIGNITDFRQRSKEERMREIRWLTWEPFEYPECVACKVLPICMAGCGYQAMFVNKDKPTCREWKYGLEHYIRDRYKGEKKLMATQPPLSSNLEIHDKRRT